MGVVPVVERIKEIISEGLETDMSLGEIASMVGISVYYMSHLFKRSTGMTVVEYRTLLRVEKAKKLLSESKKSITEISYLCGFSSQGYFSERFSKACGMSPSRFRELKKNDTLV